MNAGFDYELAHGAKDADAASKTESQPKRRVFIVLVDLQHKTLQSIRVPLNRGNQRSTAEGEVKGYGKGHG